MSPRLADEMTTETSPRTLAAVSTSDQASGIRRAPDVGRVLGEPSGGGAAPQHE